MASYSIVLSGPSSSGKSSLGREMFDLLPGPLVMIEADATYPSVKPGPSDSDEPIVDFHRATIPWMNAGYNLLIDGSLPADRTTLLRCLDVLASAGRVLIVDVFASVDALRRRELTRPEARTIGFAETQLQMHEALPYISARVDTSQLDPRAAATHVIQQLSLHED